ncbi:site-specific integrase [Candidatus Parcubacteria bacterium]|nr:MAG: site-specific integrase [Candidatus Parcubacteria bacterium]
MDQVFDLAKQLRDKNLQPTILVRKGAVKDKNKVFLIAYAYYLMGIDNENTRRHYKTVIDQFIRFIANVRGVNPLDTIGVDVLLWKDDLERTGGIGGSSPEKLLNCTPHEKSSLQNKVSILSAFFKFLQKPGLDGSPPIMIYNPVEALTSKIIVEKYANAKKISIDLLNKMLDQCDLTTLDGARNYALIYGYFMTGRRNSEWLKLQWKNLNFNRTPPTYSYIRKGDKLSNDTIPDALLEVLVVYLVKRWGEDFSKRVSDDTYLFSAIPGKGGARQLVDPNQPLNQRSMLRIVKKLAKKAGFNPRKISVHSLRHLHAETYLSQGASVEEVRARLNHQSLATTQRYLSTMTNEANRLADKLDALIHKKPQI